MHDGGKNLLTDKFFRKREIHTPNNTPNYQSVEQAELFEAILSSISDFAYTFDQDGRLLFVNQALLDLWGLKLEDAVGKNFYDLKYPADLAARLQQQIQQVFETGQRVVGETSYISPTGIEGYYEYIFSPIFTPDSSVKIVAGTTRDITKHKQAEEKIRQLSDFSSGILESITDGFFAVDDNWLFTYVNSQATRILDKTKSELIGKSLFEVYPGLIGSEFETAYRRTAKEGVTSTFTAYYPDHDRWYEVIAYPAPDGITVYFKNATERMRIEEALKESDRRKDEFLATLAHELRNPLAPIRSGLEIIRLVTNENVKVKETLNIIERQTDQIVRLVDDLLDISRITQGKIKLKKDRIELKTAIEMALETSQVLVDKAENELTVTLPSKPVFIDADLTRVAQIFLNILNNAAKYSPPGKKIELVGNIEGKEAVIRIKDTGRGIAPEMLTEVFDMFGQIETSEEDARDGLGIGLSVVKKLVEMHGGSVIAVSEGIGKGSEFVVRLPLAAEQSEANPVAQISDDKIAALQSEQRRTLVVDDNRDAVEMLKTLLTMQGHSIRTAYDGLTGIETAREFQPEICLCDIGMPGMNGYELAVQLRLMFPQVLLISISGWGQEDDRRQSKEAGFNYHLVKPVQFDELLKLIDS